jgi:tRNA pseudouridine(55) synthase
MIELYKKRGETPLEALTRLRVEQPELQSETLSYAGRLDPMAEGILPVLVGEEENKNREKFLNKDKEYYVEFLLGFSTDTGDVLGLIKDIDFKEVDESLIDSSIKNLITIKEQVYPWFSSKTVNGIPLFEYARNKDFTVTRPKRNVQIYSVSEVQIKKEDTDVIVDSIIIDIGKITGDFRQEQIVQTWKKTKEFMSDTVQIISCNINVSSGTYIRALTEILENDLKTPVVVYKLIRTKVH